MKVKVQLVVCDDNGHEETITDMIVLEKRANASGFVA